MFVYLFLLNLVLPILSMPQHTRRSSAAPAWTPRSQSPHKLKSQAVNLACWDRRRGLIMSACRGSRLWLMGLVGGLLALSSGSGGVLNLPANATMLLQEALGPFRTLAT